MLNLIVGSQGRTAIFQSFFTLEKRHLYLRELSRQTSLSAPVLQRELRVLTQAGLLLSEPDGNRISYSANVSHPLYSVLCELVRKTTGCEALLREALSGSGIAFAFIFGSMASGSATSKSDIDVFVIGDCGMREVVRLIHPVSEAISQEINPYVLTVSEFVERKSQHEHFLLDVLSKPKIFLKGTPDEFAKLAG